MSSVFGKRMGVGPGMFLEIMVPNVLCYHKYHQRWIYHTLLRYHPYFEALFLKGTQLWSSKRMFTQLHIGFFFFKQQQRLLVFLFLKRDPTVHLRGKYLNAWVYVGLKKLGGAGHAGEKAYSQGLHVFLMVGDREEKGCEVQLFAPVCDLVFSFVPGCSLCSLGPLNTHLCISVCMLTFLEKPMRENMVGTKRTFSKCHRG